MPNKTPLYALHERLGGKLVDFAGWYLPVQYKAGIMAEHAQCREKAALFDVSHMGQVEIRGSGAADAMERLCPANLTGLAEGKARYTFFTNDQGGVLDDLIVSNASDHLFVVVNASMREQDIAIMRAGLPDHEVIELQDRALLALQGPLAEAVLSEIIPGVDDLSFMETALYSYQGEAVRVSRLGYTGEDGFEISVPATLAETLAEAMLAHGDCEPAGLGARDSLRLEAGLCLYGQDLSPDISPAEAGLKWAIPKRRREEANFPGASRIVGEVSNGPSRKLVGIRPDGRAPARQGTEIHNQDGEKIGEITSGGFGPTVGGPVAMGYVDSAWCEPGSAITLMVRGKPMPATISNLPFVQQNYKR